MEIVIEIIEPSRRISQVVKFNQAQIRIGRAWDNDFVITDAEIDAYHGLIEFDEQTETFRFSDLSSANGSFYQGKKVVESTIAEFGETLTLGETTFRLHRLGDAVAPTKLHSRSEKLTKTIGRPVFASLLAMFALCFVEYFDFIDRGATFEWNIQLQSLISSATALVVWALVWGGISKLIKHNMNFFAHLALASGVMVLSSLLGQLGNIILFNTLSAGITDLYAATNTAIVVFLWMYLGLVITANVKPRTRLGVACVAVGLFLLSNYLLPRFQDPIWIADVPLETTSLPPQYLMRGETSEADFMSQARDNIERSSTKAQEMRNEKESD